MPDHIDFAIGVLNDTLEHEPDAMYSLFAYRVEVTSEEFIENSPVQVGSDSEDEPVTMGVLGLINGLFGMRDDGWGHIFADINPETREIMRFGRVTEDDVVD